MTKVASDMGNKGTGKNEAGLTLTIKGVEIPVEIRMVETTRLSYYPENPRVYSLVRAGGATPSQDDIFDALREKPHVLQLVKDIRENGGLIDPIIVKSSTMEVLEGNSRLAAYRILAQNSPQWGLIKAWMLPTAFDDDMVFALLNQYHLKGRAKWDPFERAGFLFRRWKTSGSPTSVAELSKECVEDPKEVRILLKTYDFMLDHNLEPDQWSYAYEYAKSSLIKKRREEISGFDEIIVKKIKDGELGKATDIRDKLRDVCKNPKVLKKFLNDKVTLQEGYDELEESGAHSSVVSRLKNFNAWFHTDKLEARLKGAHGHELEKLKMELRKLCKRSKRLEDRYLKQGDR
jgi:hypothetical protein